MKHIAHLPFWLYKRRLLLLVLALLCTSSIVLAHAPDYAWATTVKKVESATVGYNGIRYTAATLTDNANTPDNRKPIVTVFDKENFAAVNIDGWHQSTGESEVTGQGIYYKGPNSIPDGRISRIIGSGSRTAPALFAVRYPNAVIKEGQADPAGDVLITFSGAVLRGMLHNDSILYPTSGDAVRMLFETNRALLLNGTASKTMTPFHTPGYQGAGTFLYFTISFTKPGSTELLADDGLRVRFYDLDQPNKQGEYTGEDREGIQFQKTDEGHTVMLRNDTTIKVENLSDGLFFGSTANDDTASFKSGIIFDMPKGEEFVLWRSGANCGTFIGVDRPADGTVGPPVRTTPTKKVDKQEASVGDTLHFTCAQKLPSSTDHYPSLVFTDKLQAEIDYVNNTVKVMDGGTNITNKCSVTYKDKLLTVTVGPAYLANQTLDGQTFSVEFDAKVIDFPKSEYVKNTGKFKMGPWAPLETPPTETKINGGKIELAKTVDFEHGINDIATYTLTVSSVGKGPAKNITVTDKSLPKEFAIVDGSATIKGGTKGTVNVNGSAVTASIDQLDAGAKATITFKVSCPAAFNGTEVFNTAQATFSNPAPDAEPTVKASDGIWINNAELEVTKTADAFEYRVGDIATYTVTVVNKTQGTIARNVHIDDTNLPGRVEIDTSSIVIEGVPANVVWPIDGNGVHKEETRENGKVGAVPAGNGFTVDIPCLPFNQMVTITYKATCTRDSNGLESFNSAIVTLENPTPGEEDKIVSRDGVWTNDAQFVLGKSVDEYETQVGDTVHYAIELQNVAAGTVAKDVVLHDVTLPAGLVLQQESIAVEGVPEQVDYPIDGEGEHATEPRENSYAVKPDGNGFTVTIDYLPASVPVTVTYDALATDEVNGDEVVNTAVLQCANMLDDEVLEDDALVWVNTPHLAIEKTVKEKRTEYRMGDTVTYQIHVLNEQVGTYARAIQIADEFKQEGMQLVRSSVVVFDDAGEVVQGAAVHQTRDSASFTVETGRDLVCTAANYHRWEDAQESEQGTLNPLERTLEASLWLEFQAVVTNADLAGATLENVATASAENSEPVQDSEDIKIEGQTEPTPEPEPEPEPQPENLEQPTPAPEPQEDPKTPENPSKTPQESSGPQTTSRESSTTQQTGNNSPIARAIGKTGDWVKAHPALALAGIGLMGTGCAYAAQRRRTRKWKEHLLR